MINNFQELYDKLVEHLTGHIDAKHRDTVDLVQQEIRASEARGDKKLDLVKDEILTSTAEILDEHVLTKLDNHENRIITLEEKAKV